MKNKINEKRMYCEVNDVDVVSTEKYDLFSYKLMIYKDSNFDNFITNIKLVSLNFPLDLRTGKRYFIKNLGYNNIYRNYVWLKDSSFIELQKNDLWQYM